MARSPKWASHAIHGSRPPSPAATNHYERMGLQNLQQGFHPVATKIDANRGFNRTLVRENTKMPFGEMARDGWTIKRKRVRGNLRDDQRNANAQATGESPRLP